MGVTGRLLTIMHIFTYNLNSFETTEILNGGS